MEEQLSIPEFFLVGLFFPLNGAVTRSQRGNIMDNYDHLPLLRKTVWREWFRYPYFFKVSPGHIYRTVYREEYEEAGEYGRSVQINHVGDWVEIVLLEEQIRIQFAIF